MFDSRKIDAYFEGLQKPDTSKYEKKHSDFVWPRFVKLVFPCIAAAIFGLMVVLPNIKKSVNIKDEITLPKKNEMEKLHAEQIVLNTTDKKNRVSKVWSDTMDEIQAGSGEIKINNPRAEIPSDNGLIKLSADTGFVNQNNKILRLKNNVKASDESGNSVQTSEAIYEFEKEYGYGQSNVNAQGNWGNLTAEGFNYDKEAAVLTLLGSTVINTENGTLISQEQTQYFQNENKIISSGNALVKRENRLLYADKIINYLTNGTKKELVKTEAFGHVKIVTEKGSATADKAVYVSESKTAELFDNVVINTEKGKATANRAVYLSEQNTVKLFDNVVINTEKGTATGSYAVYNQNENVVDLYGDVLLQQDKNFMRGNHVHTDLNTSISTIKADKKAGFRVSGTFYNKKRSENGKKTN